MLGFYARHLDPLSKYFNGEFSATHRRRFARNVLHYFVEYYFYQDDPDTFHKMCIEYRSGLDQRYLFRSAYCLYLGYGIIPRPTLLTPLFCDDITSKPHISEIKTLKNVKLSPALKKYIEINKMTFEIESIFALVDVVLSSNLKDIDYFGTVLLDKSWKVTRRYSSSSTAGYTSGFYNIECWSGDTFKAVTTHTLLQAGNDLPVLYYKLGTDSTYCPKELSRIFAKSLEVSKNIENFARNALDVPLVGQGRWISETMVLRIIERSTSHTVIHQWNPKFLGQQRFDIGIPSLNLAFEFNGIQHYRPIEFFGGKKGFERTCERDERKRILCRENNIHLVEIRYDTSDEQIELIVNQTIKKLGN